MAGATATQDYALVESLAIPDWNNNARQQQQQLPLCHVPQAAMATSPPTAIPAVVVAVVVIATVQLLEQQLLVISWINPKVASPPVATDFLPQSHKSFDDALALLRPVAVVAGVAAVVASAVAAASAAAAADVHR